MSFIARYNDWFLGGLIGHPKLTAQQWRGIRVFAMKRHERGAWALLTFFLPAAIGGILIVFGLDSLMQSISINISDWPARIVQVLAFAVYLTLVIELRYRLFMKTHIRAAANDLGLVRVCPACGYDLKGSAVGDADVCPECGTATNPRPHTAP